MKITNGIYICLKNAPEYCVDNFQQNRPLRYVSTRIKKYEKYNFFLKKVDRENRTQ